MYVTNPPSTCGECDTQVHHTHLYCEECVPVECDWCGVLHPKVQSSDEWDGQHCTKCVEVFENESDDVLIEFLKKKYPEKAA